MNKSTNNERGTINEHFLVSVFTPISPSFMINRKCVAERCYFIFTFLANNMKEPLINHFQAKIQSIPSDYLDSHQFLPIIKLLPWLWFCELITKDVYLKWFSVDYRFPCFSHFYQCWPIVIQMINDSVYNWWITYYKVNVYCSLLTLNIRCLSKD